MSILVHDLNLMEIFWTVTFHCIAKAWAWSFLGVKHQVKKKIAKVAKSLQNMMVKSNVV